MEQDEKPPFEYDPASGKRFRHEDKNASDDDRSAAWEIEGHVEFVYGTRDYILKHLKSS